MSEELPVRLPPVDAARAEVPASSLSPELLASLLVDGDDELAAWTLEHALAERSRPAVFDDLLVAAMTLIGERWRAGQWSVADEHLASQTLLRALDRIRPEMGPEGRIGPLAVLGGVAGEHHMLGLVCLAQVLEEGGWTVANLGADVPTADLARFVARNEARLVALTASDPERLETLIGSIAAVRAVDADVAILLGGRLAARPGLAGTLGIDWAGTSLVDADAIARGIADGLERAGT
jgi:methanogenic corrinoid protein MtbC1